MSENMSLSKITLKKLLSRFSKDVIFNQIIQMDDFKHINKEVIMEMFKKNKIVISDLLVSEIQESQLNEVYGKLEILYFQSTLSKKWNVYEMINSNSNHSNHFNKLSLYENIKKYMNSSRFKIDIMVEMNKSSLWIRISIIDPLKMNALPDRTFLVYNPGSKYILISSFNKKFKEYLFECLCGTFSCESLEPQALSGQDVDSLYNMSERKSKASKAMNHKSLNTLVNEEPSNVADDLLLNNRIIDDDVEMKEANKQYADLKFGKENSMPVLKRLHYETETKLHPITNQMPDWEQTDILKCTVFFQGSNVLNGIKNFVKHGVAEAPLPPYVANVTRLGKDVLKIKEK